MSNIELPMMNDEPERDSEIHLRMTPSALDVRHSPFNTVKAVCEEISLAVLASWRLNIRGEGR